MIVSRMRVHAPHTARPAAHGRLRHFTAQCRLRNRHRHCGPGRLWAAPTSRRTRVGPGRTSRHRPAVHRCVHRCVHRLSTGGAAQRSACCPPPADACRWFTMHRHRPPAVRCARASPAAANTGSSWSRRQIRSTLAHPRLRRDQPVPASCPAGGGGDLDQGAEPTGVARRQPAQIEQQPDKGGGAAPPGQPTGGCQIQLTGRGQDLDPITVADSRRLAHALSPCRSALPSVPVYPAVTLAPPHASTSAQLLPAGHFQQVPQLLDAHRGGIDQPGPAGSEVTQPRPPAR
jgi:hypothetical protein